MKEAAILGSHLGHSGGHPFSCTYLESHESPWGFLLTPSPSERVAHQPVNILQEGVEAPPEEEGLLDGGIEEDFDVFGAAPVPEEVTELSPSSPPELPHPVTYAGTRLVRDLELRTGQLNVSELSQVWLSIKSIPL